MEELIKSKQLPSNHVILRIRDYDGRLVDTIAQPYDGTVENMMKRMGNLQSQLNWMDNASGINSQNFATDNDRFSLWLPKEAIVLSFQCQNGVPCIWAMVETEHINEDRKFRLYGTGHPIADIPKDADLHYIGTAQQIQMPPLVWHLFEETRNE